MLKTVCVYCGSSPGNNPLYAQAAHELGKIIAQKGLRLVYGAGDGGLMGILARSVLEHGGYVTGIVPDFIRDLEPTIHDAQELIVVKDMHERKRQMFERADAFIALPGGVGTLEELVEQLAWVQLHRHHKPLVLVDIAGFWRPLLSLFAHMREHGFIRPTLEISYQVAEYVEDIIPIIEKDLKPRSPRFSSDHVAENSLASKTI